jgi:hypothetical protein
VIRIALDTNILAYLAGVDRGVADGAKIDRAREVVAGLGVRARLAARRRRLESCSPSS